jgi:surface antigen
MRSGRIRTLTILLLAAATLPGCAQLLTTQYEEQVATAPPRVLLAWNGATHGVSCVPYARAVSGIRISGDAHVWWSKAAGRYQRGQTPQPGSVLAFKPSGTMRAGHVSVVEQLVDARTILVTHANWGGRDGPRGRIATGHRVVDVSPGNDWTEVRVANAAGTIGRIYPTHGFIHADTAVAEARAR